MKTRKLGSVISISKGKKHLVVEVPSSSSKRLLGIDDLRNDNLLRYTDDQSGTAVLPGDVLIAWDGANAGTIGFGKYGYIGSTIARLRVNEKEKIFTPFLGTFLKSKFDYLRQTATGATIPHISRRALDDIEIPDVDFEDQIRISHLLGKVEGLIAQRKKHLQQLDDLLKSVFLDMFGDPVRNEKGWPINPLATYMSEQPNNGLYKPQSSYGSGTKIIRIDSFYDGIVQNIDVLKRVETTDAELLKFNIRPFDVLVNRVNSIEYLGKIGVVPAISEPMVYESNMMRFRLNHEAMFPVFLMYFWRTPYLKSQINSKAKKAVNQASVNQQDVLGLLIPGPPIELQRKFVSIFEKVEGIISCYQASLTDLEALYGALSQKAFKGELDLSQVTVPIGCTS